MQNTFSVVIPAAGIGSRMGLGFPKALIKINGKSLLQRHLEHFGDNTTVVVVAGYNSGAVVDELMSLRAKISIVFNHDFLTTGTASSVKRAIPIMPEGMVLILEGDLLVSQETMRKFLWTRKSALGIGPVRSEMPVYAHLDSVERNVIRLSQTDRSAWEWSGLALIPREVCRSFDEGHVFQSLVPFLPLPAVLSDWREIDFPEDVETALDWVMERETG